MTGRRLGRLAAKVALVAGVACSAGVVAAAPASAHPLGNATVNHYDGLTLFTDHIDNTAVEDIAEIPTFQRKVTIDKNSDGVLSPAERAAYAATQCASLAAGDHLTVAGSPVAWQVLTSAYSERPGAINLKIGRLVCDLRAKADLTSGATVALSDSWDGDGVGWHEITAVAEGVSLKNSPVPAASISDDLLHYPNDLLTSPLTVRSTILEVTPGAGGSTYARVKSLPVAGFFVRELNKGTNGFNNLLGRKNLGLGIGVLAVLLSMLLGAGHAFLPGHGKTVMAAYLVGKRGRLRDVVTVGATVTITHTAGVLILGLLITLGAQFATVVVEQDLAIVSGGTVALVGLGLLASAVRRRRGEQASVESQLNHLEVDALAVEEALVHQPTHDTPARTLVLHGASAQGMVMALAEPRDHPHSHVDHPHHDHDHPHRDLDHPHHDHDDHRHPHAAAAGSAPHSHGWGKAHSHAPGGAHAPAFSRGGLIGLGAAGGLVPSPSALVVLLAAVTAGRTYFGVGLVLAYGLGMALALCVAGLLVVRLQDRLTRLLAGRKIARLGWIASALPILTASLVLIVGLGLMAKAISGSF
jgi:nickel/cobalt transporter (NicO) family protein